jgi:5-methylcytosine-specific restriction endonuclease McrA
MSAHRRPAIPFSDAPRGTCRWCGEAIVHEDGAKRGEPNRRRRWHPACVSGYEESDPREARRRVRKRDRGRCATCGLDTVKLRGKIRGKGAFAKTRELGFKPRKSFWELDHIVPLIDGGGHELSNLQTLCTPCHKRKTTAEAAERRSTRAEAAERDVLDRADELLARSQQLLDSLGPPPES